MKEKKEMEKTHNWVSLIFLLVVCVILIVVFVRAQQSMNKCDEAIRIWQNATRHMDLETTQFDTLCQMYCRIT